MTDNSEKNIKYPAIKPCTLSPDTLLFDDDNNEIAKLSDYWSWAHSELLCNTERGIIAEYLVACALGIQKNDRESWDKYDLLSSNGIRIEVKASGYIQTWAQKELSKIVFGVHKSYGWNSTSGKYDDTQKRQSDVYVFCVHKHKEQDTVNPLNAKQWDFYVVSTKFLNDKIGNQKTISLSSVEKLEAIKCSYSQLKETIERCMEYKNG